MYLLDTNTIIDFCNAKLPANAKQFLLNIDQPAISVITRIELYSSNNIPEQEKSILNQFVLYTTIYDNINLDIINTAIPIRQTLKIKLPDAIIASTAIVYNLTLITRNTKDFINIDSLKVMNPYDM